MPLIYGEGDNALRRLQKEINDRFGADVAASLSDSSKTRSLGVCLNSAPVIQPQDFVGRSAEINNVHNILQPDPSPVEQRRVVLGGMGGVGKTQLALAYARRYERSYTSVLWFNASTELTLFTSLQSIAQALMAADVLEKLNHQQILARVQEWLSQPGNTEWLLIFDNYDDPDQFDISRFYPMTSRGSIIVTTRLPDLVSGLQVRVRSLTEMEDSLDILQTRSGRSNVRKGKRSLYTASQNSSVLIQCRCRCVSLSEATGWSSLGSSYRGRLPAQDQPHLPAVPRRLRTTLAGRPSPTSTTPRRPRPHAVHNLETDLQPAQGRRCRGC